MLIILITKKADLIIKINCNN